jgi:hypothetical protein
MVFKHNYLNNIIMNLLVVSSHEKQLYYDRGKILVLLDSDLGSSR